MDRQQEIQCVAYQLWEEEGQPFGRDLEFYFKAEAILLYQQRHGQASASSQRTPVGARRS
jgi:hypothetical protein